MLCANLRQRKTNLQKCGGVLSPELEAKKPNKMLSYFDNKEINDICRLQSFYYFFLVYYFLLWILIS